LRELLAARSGRDGIVASPPQRSRARPAPSLGVRVAAALAANPASVVGTLLVAGAGLAIGLNALALQTARHPAPLFQDRGRVLAEAPPPPVRRVEAPPRVESPPRVEPPVPAPLPPARPATAYNAAPAPAPATPLARGTTARDPIGDLLRGSEATGAVARTSVASVDPQRTVSGAQRALVRLGYGPLTTDGVMGPATRSAIERFERDRRLTPTGELNPRTVRELTAAFGQPLD